MIKVCSEEPGIKLTSSVLKFGEPIEWVGWEVNHFFENNFIDVHLRKFYDLACRHELIYLELR